MANLLRHALNHTQRKKGIPRESEFHALGINHLDKHDGPARIDRIANDLAKGYRVNPELSLNLKDPASGWSLKSLIDQAYQQYWDRLVGEADGNFSPFEILELIILKQPKAKDEKKKWEARIEQAAAFIPIHVCRDIVGNTICADFLDYLFRDWYHLGKEFNEDPRLYHYMEARAPTESPDDRSKWKFVINVGESTSPRHDAITNILDLLEARYKLAETVLFHRTKLSATALLDRCLLEIRRLHEHASHRASLKDWELKLKNSLAGALISGSDDALPDILRQIAFGTESESDHPYRKAAEKERRGADQVLRPNPGAIETEGDAAKDQDLLTANNIGETEVETLEAVPLTEHQELIEQLLLALENREIYTKAFRFGRFDLTGTDRETRQNEIIALYEEPKARSEYLGNLEAMCGFPHGSVSMYCSRDPKMNAKIAYVDLLIDDSIKSFKAYEDQEQNEGLTGDALKAQINRFQALWSATIYIRRDVWCQLSADGKQDLREVLKESFLPMSYWGAEVTSLEHHRKGMQSRIDNLRREVKSHSPIAARSGTDVSPKWYFQGSTFPNGLPVDVTS